MNIIPIIDDNVQADTLPVIKTTYYPWTDDSFKPFMHFRPAFNDQGLFLDLICFERDPAIGTNVLNSISQGSCAAVSVSFDLKGPQLTVVFTADGKGALFVGDGSQNTPENPIPIKGELSKGEDEVGWFWEVRWTLKKSMIRSLGAMYPEDGSSVFMNAYKFQKSGHFSHFGCVAPTAIQSVYYSGNLDEFKVVKF